MNESRLEAKIDKLDDHLAKIDITLAKQAVVLDEHVKRTTLLESRVEPIERHVLMVNSALKLIAIVALILGIIVGVEQLLGHIK